MVLEQGTYYLFYSGGHFFARATPSAWRAAPARSGPAPTRRRCRWFRRTSRAGAPGRNRVFTNSDGVWMIYSPWFANLSGDGPPRPVALARLGFGAAGPYLAAPYQSSGTAAGTTASSRAP